MLLPGQGRQTVRTGPSLWILKHGVSTRQSIVWANDGLMSTILFEGHELAWIAALLWASIIGIVLAWAAYQIHSAYTRRMVQAAGQLAHVTLSSVSDGIIHTDAEGIVTFCNVAATKILGIPQEKIVGFPFKSTVHLYKGEAQVLVENPATFPPSQNAGDYLDPYSGVRTADDDIRPISETISHVRDASGKVTGAVFVFHDVSGAREFSHQLHYQARHDPLTGLPNRRAFEEGLAVLARTTLQDDDRAFLMYLDVDHFKMINDVHGHHVGDNFLRAFAALLRSLLKPEDELARLGGDEFAITVRRVDAGQAQQLAERLIAAVGAYRFDIDGRQFEAGVSIGIVAIIAGHCDPSALMARADTACYAAKDRGRGRCHLYLADDPYILIAEHTLDCANRVQRAFDENRFEVHLQKIVGRDRKLLGYESLIRMRSETGDLVMPGAFMPAIQRMGWITRIDQWMLQHVIAVARGWPSSKDKQPYLSLNLSARSIGDEAFVDGMLALLDSSGVHNRVLRFEITETDQLRTTATEMRLIDQLHQRGFMVWLDDVGTGYNSFDLLKRLRVDGIKIDQSFTRALIADPVDRALTEALIAIGKIMQLEVVAEGVEDEETYQALLTMDADAFQGHRFHKAESASDVLLQRIAEQAPGPQGLDIGSKSRRKMLT